MLIRIEELLDGEELAVVAGLIESLPFSDGRSSAGMAAARVKRNQEAAEHPNRRAISNLVMGKLLRHPDCRLAALPRQVAQPLLARYTTGMEYGDHIDDPIMGGDHPFRTDVAVTVFLNPPQDYEGGALVIQTDFGEQTVKLAAGSAVLYPASSRHRVEMVSRGERRVMVSWIQSLVADSGRRELLYELGLAREKLLQDSPDSLVTKRIDKSYVNLIRMWARPEPGGAGLADARRKKPASVRRFLTPKPPLQSGLGTLLGVGHIDHGHGQVTVALTVAVQRMTVRRHHVLFHGNTMLVLVSDELAMHLQHFLDLFTIVTHAYSLSIC